AAVVAPLADAMFPQDQTCKPHACPDDLVLVSRDHAAHVTTTALSTVAAVILFAGAFWLLVGRWRRATPAMRRQLRPVYLAGGLSVVLVAGGFIGAAFSGVGNTIVSVALLVTVTAGPFLVPAGVRGPAPPR